MNNEYYSAVTGQHARFSYEFTYKYVQVFYDKVKNLYIASGYAMSSKTVKGIKSKITVRTGMR